MASSRRTRGEWKSEEMCSKSPLLVPLWFSLAFSQKLLLRKTNSNFSDNFPLKSNSLLITLNSP
ncbi:hypothetical protein MTR_2g047812 [Medicago truncatula]|uniref:Uncharacterized protein n=1 Tax=Medicago truncatula TaxID=3880 RepID=A0A072V834_MEDTR|nr:hypothetical protein MTR_2g047812 [Medicago truncatula]